MSRICSFTVLGAPQPKGSVSTFPVKKKDGTMGVNVVHPKQGWVHTVSLTALQAMRQAQQWEPLDGPVRLIVTYYLPRGKTVKRALPTVKPDLDKLDRAVLDGLTHVVYVDDAQVVEIRSRKLYAPQAPGAVVEVYEGGNDAGPEKPR